jgi:hypothetical protein
LKDVLGTDLRLEALKYPTARITLLHITPLPIMAAHRPFSTDLYIYATDVEKDPEGQGVRADIF